MVPAREGRVTAIVPAAGIGKRMGGTKPKQFLELNGRPLFIMTLERLEAAGSVDDIILVVPEGDIEAVKKEIDRRRLRKIQDVVPGGRMRQHSVARGLRACPPSTVWVAVHDGARPFVSPDLVDRTVLAARVYGAAVPVLPVADTVKRGDGTWVTETVDRRGLWRTQTPQCCRRDWLEQAFAAAGSRAGESTDEAGLLERLGRRIRMVPGEWINIKITTPEDMVRAKLYAREGS